MTTLSPSPSNERADASKTLSGHAGVTQRVRPLQGTPRVNAMRATSLDCVTATDTSPTIGVSQPASVAEFPVDADRILSTRRYALVLAVTIFVTTTIQVLAAPVAALVEGRAEWPLAMPVPIAFTILVLGCAVQAASFLLSNDRPELTVLVTAAVFIGLAVGLSVPSWLIGMYLVIAISLFLLAARRSLTTAVVWLVLVVVVTVGALFLWTMMIGLPFSVAVGFVTTEAIRIAAPAMAGTALGVWWGAQTRRVNLARAQAKAAKRDHDKRVEEAEQRERARIAQELHDVAGQHLAGLITLADAALTIAPARPDQALHLVEEVRDEGRFAAASLAGALADLRAVGTEPRETTRDLRQADELFEYWQKRGMTIRLATAGPVEELPAVVSTTAYRCTQEAITNAAKHAPGAEVDIEITARSNRLDVAITNAPSPSGVAPVPGLSLAWGLSGIRERIDLLRGTLVFGTTPEGGWMVRFVIPVAQPD